MVITEFVDYQCPFCRAAQSIIDSVMAAQPTEVRLVVHHLPLAGHNFAVQAAVAAECADRQGKFSEMHRVLLERQNELKPGVNWNAYAVDSEVSDTTAFLDCIQLPSDSFPRIAAGLERSSAEFSVESIF